MMIEETFRIQDEVQRGSLVESLPEEEIKKPSRAERWKRSVTARLRRQYAKIAKMAHSYKEDRDAQERLKAKRLLEKQKKEKRKKVVDTNT